MKTLSVKSAANDWLIFDLAVINAVSLKKQRKAGPKVRTHNSFPYIGEQNSIDLFVNAQRVKHFRLAI